MEFLNPGLLGSASDFRRAFSVPDPALARRRRRRPPAAARRPFILRRLKTDRSIIADLPEKMEMKVFCTLTREQASLYEAVVDEMMDKVESSEGIERRGLVLAMLTKLKQVCNHPAQFLQDDSAVAGRSGKLARLEEMLEEVLAAGDRALVFTQFAEMGDLLRAHLAGALRPRGAVPARRHARKSARDELVERFQAPGGPPVLRPVAQGGRHRPEPDRAPTTSSTSTAGGTPPSRTRPPTAPSASARRATCRCTSSSAPARWKSGSTR